MIAAHRDQQHDLGVELPKPAEAVPAAVSALINHGLREDVPALKARSEYLD